MHKFAQIFIALIVSSPVIYICKQTLFLHLDIQFTVSYVEIPSFKLITVYCYHYSHLYPIQSTEFYFLPLILPRENFGFK